MPNQSMVKHQSRKLLPRRRQQRKLPLLLALLTTSLLSKNLHLHQLSRRRLQRQLQHPSWKPQHPLRLPLSKHLHLLLRHQPKRQHLLLRQLVNPE